GGECFLYKGFLDLVREASSSGLKVTVTTHGGFIKKGMESELRACGFESIAVSVDHSTADVHDRERGAGAFDRAIQGMQVIREAGIPLELVTVLTRTNMDDVARIAQLAEANGARKVHFKDFKEAGNGSESAAQYRLSVDEKKRVWGGIVELQKDLESLELEFGVHSEPAPNRIFGDGTVSACSCGSMSACLRENGKISACSYSDAFIGDLLEESL